MKKYNAPCMEINSYSFVDVITDSAAVVDGVLLTQESIAGVSGVAASDRAIINWNTWSVEAEQLKTAANAEAADCRCQQADEC